MIKLDFLARRRNYIDHLAPVWNKFPIDRRGYFFISHKDADYAVHELGPDGLVIFEEHPPKNSEAILVCSYGDLSKALSSGGKIITMEHGTGHSFGTSAYPDGKGKREYVDLALVPNEYTAKIVRAARSTKVIVIGTPKMDAVYNSLDFGVDLQSSLPKEPVIAVAFHWGNRYSKPAESGSAWEHYKDILPEIAKQYKMIGHGHPLAREFYKNEFEKIGVEYVEDFREVIKRAHVYINDLSSTLYEFLVTGKPVIVLNAPWFRRELHWGIRFWDYSDVGINVEEPAELLPAIGRTIDEYNSIHFMERYQAIVDLYPYLGISTHRAIQSILEFLDGNPT